MTDHDFDQARRERPDGFIIGGERFALRDPGFKEVGEWQDEPPVEGQSRVEADEATAAFIEKFIDEADVGRWRKLLERKEDAITRGDLMGLGVWLMEQHTERPTLRPSSSERGPVHIPTGSAGVPRSQGSARGA